MISNATINTIPIRMSGTINNIAAYSAKTAPILRRFLISGQIDRKLVTKGIAILPIVMYYRRTQIRG